MVDGLLPPRIKDEERERADHATERDDSSNATPTTTSLHTTASNDSSDAIPTTVSDKKYNLRYDEDDLQTLILYAREKMTGKWVGMMHGGAEVKEGWEEGGGVIF